MSNTPHWGKQKAVVDKRQHTHTNKKNCVKITNCVPIFLKSLYNGMICTWSCCKLAIQTRNTCSLDKRFSPRGANFRQCSTRILLTTQFVLLITFSSRLKYRLERKCSLIKNWYCLQENCNFALEFTGICSNWICLLPPSQSQNGHEVKFLKMP